MIYSITEDNFVGSLDKQGQKQQQQQQLGRDAIDRQPATNVHTTIPLTPAENSNASGRHYSTPRTPLVYTSCV